MRCRRIVQDSITGKQNIVWFGSAGTYIENGVKKAIKIENYSEKQEAVRNSLIQRLSVIKGELWYKASYGLPLMDNIKNKGIYDSVIINIIMEHPDVRSIVYFNSEIVDHKYTFDFVVDSIYNEDVSISYEI